MNFKKYVPALAVSAALVLSALIARAAAPQFLYESKYTKDEVDKAKESIALSLMGQLQMSFGDLMWMKSLEYLHNGITYRMPTNAEKHAGFVERDSINTPGGLDHTEGVSMALDEARDWRGIIGDLHREIVPYQAEHKHSDPVELIPWYQLMVKLNPHLERLYSMGAFFMADFAHEPEEALELLEGGAKANPWSYEIYSALGHLRYEYFQDYEQAAKDLERAVEMGDAERERLRSDHESLDAYQKQLYEEAYLFLARSYTELGRYEEAIAVCESGYKKTAYNHLRVQQRITTRRRDGLAPGEELPPLHPKNQPATPVQKPGA
jgi:tetratricopeptide (TPR) repeat protein